jgi:hypothetical protein
MWRLQELDENGVKELKKLREIAGRLYPEWGRSGTEALNPPESALRIK